MNFLTELKIFILSHPVTSKQPHKIVQIHMRHPVCSKCQIDGEDFVIFFVLLGKYELYELNEKKEGQSGGWRLLSRQQRTHQRLASAL